MRYISLHESVVIAPLSMHFMKLTPHSFYCIFEYSGSRVAFIRELYMPSPRRDQTPSACEPRGKLAQQQLNWVPLPCTKNYSVVSIHCHPPCSLLSLYHTPIIPMSECINSLLLLLRLNSLSRCSTKKTTKRRPFGNISRTLRYELFYMFEWMGWGRPC